MLLILILIVNGCDFGEEENSTYIYRYRITVETDLPSIRIDNTYMDSTTIYPYTLYENSGAGMDKYLILRIYPIQDSGYIKLNLFGGISFSNPSLNFKDSLTISTPIDTTNVRARLTLNESDLEIISKTNFYNLTNQLNVIGE